MIIPGELATGNKNEKCSFVWVLTFLEIFQTMYVHTQPTFVSFIYLKVELLHIVHLECTMHKGYGLGKVWSTREPHVCTINNSSNIVLLLC